MCYVHQNNHSVYAVWCSLRKSPESMNWLKSNCTNTQTIVFALESKVHRMIKCTMKSFRVQCENINSSELRAFLFLLQIHSMFSWIFVFLFCELWSSKRRYSKMSNEAICLRCGNMVSQSSSPFESTLRFFFFYVGLFGRC